MHIPFDNTHCVCFQTEQLRNNSKISCLLLIALLLFIIPLDIFLNIVPSRKRLSPNMKEFIILKGKEKSCNHE